MPPKKKAHELLARQRERLGMSQRELARRTGVNVSTVTRRESGEISCSPMDYDAWERALAEEQQRQERKGEYENDDDQDQRH